MEDQARITVIATGFSSPGASSRKNVFARQIPEEPKAARESQTVRESEEPLLGFDDTQTDEAPPHGREREADASRFDGRTRDPYVRRDMRPDSYPRRPLAPKPEHPADDDDLDIPPSCVAAASAADATIYRADHRPCLIRHNTIFPFCWVHDSTQYKG